jgi:hypothetical protein
VHQLVHQNRLLALIIKALAPQHLPQQAAVLHSAVGHPAHHVQLLGNLQLGAPCGDPRQRAMRHHVGLVQVHPPLHRHDVAIGWLLRRERQLWWG